MRLTARNVRLVRARQRAAFTATLALAVMLALQSVSAQTPTGPAAGVAFSFTPENPTDLEVVEFRSTATVTSGRNVAWIWWMGDGTVLSGERVSHGYKDDGSFVVRLNVTNESGGWSWTERSIHVQNVAPQMFIGVTPRDGEANFAREYDFYTTGGDDDGRIVNWTWSFGDGTYDFGDRPIHRFPGPGEYSVELVARDDDGATDRDFTIVSVLDSAANAATSSTHEHFFSLRILAADGSPWPGAEITMTYQGMEGLLGVTDRNGYSPPVQYSHAHADPTDHGTWYTKISGNPYTYPIDPADGALQTIRADDPAGRGGQETSNYGPEMPTPDLHFTPTGAMIAAAGTAAVAGGLASLYALSDRFKWKWFMMLLPLYTRLQRQSVLEHGMRETIYGYIEEHPGVHLRGIQRDLKMKYGTLIHHLRVLESQQYIRTARDGMFLRFYPIGVAPPLETHDPLAEEVLRYILAHPACTNAEVARSLAKSPSLVHYHVERLAHVGRVRKERYGREVRLIVVPPSSAA